jgi:DNA-binding LytR/AlgR family response regulator
VADACFSQASDKYTSVVTRDSEYLLRMPLKELAAQLDPELFWQIHRGTLVNVQQIKAARRNLRDRPETLVVSRSYAHLFRRR